MDHARLSRAFQWYYRVRSLIPIRVRQWLQARRTLDTAEDKQWYIPRAFMDGLLAADPGVLAGIQPWPDGTRWALVLTHDVETSDGLRLVPQLSELEEELGFRSCWNIIPYKYPVDRGLIRDLRQRGFEIGVHGYNHDGRLFSSEHVFKKRSTAINRSLAEWNAVGFRAPMVHRNLDWIDKYLDIQYDASCFDIDPYQAMPGGVGSLWPFMFGQFVELPYTLPQDHTLFVALHETTDRIWREKTDFIRQHQGMGLLVTHPDYLHTPRLRDIYRGYLEHTLSLDDFWHVLPRDIARWWRKRYTELPQLSQP